MSAELEIPGSGIIGWVASAGLTVVGALFANVHKRLNRLEEREDQRHDAMQEALRGLVTKDDFKHFQDTLVSLLRPGRH